MKLFAKLANSICALYPVVNLQEKGNSMIFDVRIFSYPVDHVSYSLRRHRPRSAMSHLHTGSQFQQSAAVRLLTVVSDWRTCERHRETVVQFVALSQELWCDTLTYRGCPYFTSSGVQLLVATLASRVQDLETWNQKAKPLSLEEWFV
jgi:hypothetical protein